MMILPYLRRSKRPVSTVLILCLGFECIIPYTSRATTLSSGGGTVASSLSSMVDGYTGDFRYSVPLVTLPGPNGESVDISASYRAGIAVNQKASWIGLGWDYNPGEISRQVVGAPDDYNGVRVDQYSTYGPQLKQVAMFGSLYNNEFNRNTTTAYKAGDNTTMYYNMSATERNNLITQANTGNTYNPASLEPNSNASYRFNKHTVPHTSLAYDRYSVSGSGIGGSIHPYYLGEVNIHQEINGAASNDPVSSRKCQFYFENSTAMQVFEGNRTNANVVNQSTNRVHSGTFVKYFTNAEINNNSSLYSSGNPSGYLDYKPITNVSLTRRPSNSDRPDAIGAFLVTNPAGMTYHYSLPVYELENLNANFEGIGSSQLSHLKLGSYATSWKLTAITGPDYEDTNGNYTADEGDTGYWIAYSYSLWSSDYEWASQRYNAKSDALISPKMVDLVTSAAVGNQYRRTNSLSFGRSTVYALNYIRTATHTAYFVKSIRQDEQSYSNVMGSSKPVASLKLDRVVLLRNEDKGLLINSTPLGGSDLDGRFDYSTCGSALGDNNFVNVTRYLANKTAIDAAALSTAELSQNYCLAKNYTGNINNTFTTSMDVFSPHGIPGHTVSGLVPSWYKKVNGFSGTTAPGNNGKLTLKKITVYSLKGEKVTPSVDFSYDENNSTKNPDFDGDKTDLWGYYKSDYVNSHFVTMVSKDHVDAWSLKEINTPLGGKIAITYESDVYHKEGFAGDAPFYKIFTGSPGQYSESSNMPNLIFPMSNINSGGHVTFYDHDITHFVNFTNEPVSDPTYLHPMYAIYSQREECFHPIVYYGTNGGSYYPPVYRNLVRYGSSFSNGTAGSGTGPYVSMLAGSSAEYNFNCARPGYSQGSTTLNNVGVNHAVIFRSYLYGGGVRVNSIKVTDPFSNSSYTQRFEYGKGYCPVVPKSTAFSTYSGPSNHDVVMNLKPMMMPQLAGLVGYDYCTQYSVNQNSQSTGRVEQVYTNELLMTPLALMQPAMTKTVTTLCNRMKQNDPQSGCASPPYTGNCMSLVVDYTAKLDLSLNNSNLLGKLKSTSDGISTTSYFYQSTFIKETYLHPKVEVVKYTNPFVYSLGSSKQCRYDYTCEDKYIYDRSYAYEANTFLSSTETVKDGIKIREEIKREPYTGMPSYTKTTDPTRGVYESTTDFAFLQTIPNSSTRLYPAMDLKSKNESNRNLLTAVGGTKTIKDGACVISESKATYSNVYPVRELSGTASNITKPWYHLHESYQRLLDDDIPASMAAQASDWRKLSTNTLYDASYNCIEQEGLNGRRAASRWGYGGLYKLADISNANYNSFTFSGFEDPVVYTGLTYCGGEIMNGQCSQPASAQTVNNVTYPVLPHTGSRMAGVVPNGPGPLFSTRNFETGRSYAAKVWVHKLSPPTAALTIEIDGTAGGGSYTDTKTVMRNNAANVTVGDWVLMSVEIEVPANFYTGSPHNMKVSLSNTGGASKAYFDDLAFHPKDAVMTGNVYNAKTGALEAQLDNDNFATCYTYDNAMRLTSASKEYSGGIKKVSESLYHYAKP